MGFDLNPLHSSLFTGAGTPWGAPDYGTPDKPSYQTDPMQSKGFDYKATRKAMEQGLREQRALRDQGNKFSLAKANSYGGGTSAGRLAGLSAAQTEGDINQGNAAITHQDYSERVAAMNAKNTALRAEYDAALKRAQREEDQRQGFLDKGSSVLTLGLGG